MSTINFSLTIDIKTEQGSPLHTDIEKFLNIVKIAEADKQAVPLVTKELFELLDGFEANDLHYTYFPTTEDTYINIKLADITSFEIAKNMLENGRSNRSDKR